jgi:hypothetical protein
MPSWPRSTYAAIVAALALCAAAALWMYTETRSAYRAVGFNDGQIQQRDQTMKMIQKSVAVEDCKRLEISKPPIELLAVKGESLYMSVADDGSVRFCR